VRARGGPSAKSIYDPVHGAIELEGAALELIGHPAFQRLWGIRQTGLAHLVFPGANHTRLEHSLGVSWVASRMASALDLSDEDRRLVACGGLLHDLGHGPFSHTLDGAMEEALGHGHERLSRELIVGSGEVSTGHPPLLEPAPSILEILERHDIDPIAVADLVDPPAKGRPSRLRSVLHGPVDADRLDYLQRDAHYTGVAHGAIDAMRLLDTLRSKGELLYFEEKGRSAVEGFLLGRSLMYNAVYFHKTVRAAEVMLSAAVERHPGFPEAAIPWFNFTDGDLLAALRADDGFSAAIGEAIRSRTLYKRIGGFRRLSLERRRAFRRALQRGRERRRIEDELAAAIRAPPGSVLLDVAGLSPRAPGVQDLRDIAIQEGDELLRPFAQNLHWRTLLLRPPTPWALGIYAPARFRRAAEARLPRALSRVL
jgi:uncharacterized protein